MYDPHVGRWTTTDPKGFEAGDADLYRFVGNDPTNATDPSGLEAKELSLAADFVRPSHFNAATTIRTSGTRLAGPDFDQKQQNVILGAHVDAVRRLEDAEIVLLYYWDQLKEMNTINTPGAKPFVSKRYQTLAGSCTGEGSPPSGSGQVKDFYLGKIKEALSRFNEQGYVQMYNPAAGVTGWQHSEADAYTMYPFGLYASRRIYLTNHFFERGSLRRTDVIVHEFGRQVGFDQENTGNIYKDVYEWDLTIDWLEQQYVELQRLGK